MPGVKKKGKEVVKRAKKVKEKMDKKSLAKHVQKLYLYNEKPLWHSKRIVWIARKRGLGEHVDVIIEKMSSKGTPWRAKEKLAISLGWHSMKEAFTQRQVNEIIKAVGSKQPSYKIKEMLALSLINHSYKKEFTSDQIISLLDVASKKDLLGSAKIGEPGEPYIAPRKAYEAGIRNAINDAIWHGSKQDLKEHMKLIKSMLEGTVKLKNKRPQQYFASLYLKQTQKHGATPNERAYAKKFIKKGGAERWARFLMLLVAFPEKRVGPTQKELDKAMEELAKKAEFWRKHGLAKTPAGPSSG